MSISSDFLSVQCPVVCGVSEKDDDAAHVQSAKPEDVGRDASGRDAKRQIAALTTDVDSLRRQLADRDAYVATVEKQLSSRLAEISVSVYTLSRKEPTVFPA